MGAVIGDHKSLLAFCVCIANFASSPLLAFGHREEETHKIQARMLLFTLDDMRIVFRQSLFFKTFLFMLGQGGGVG
jgi:hypothetical protein